MAAKEICRMEFFFKLNDLRELIENNSTAEGIIISHEIKRLTDGTPLGLNLSLITARAIAGSTGTSTNGQEVDGCPYPPGCPDDPDGPAPTENCIGAVEEAVASIASITQLKQNNFMF